MRAAPDRVDPTLADRLRRAFLKPEKPGSTQGRRPSKPPSVAELEAGVRGADDKERLIGLLAAPVAAAIGFLVIGSQIVNDPPARLANGSLNRLHVNVAVYHDVLLVLLALSVAMMTLALLRKRLFLGVATALYGLAMVNLRWWGFGLPFLMVGSWLIVRSYRLQRDLRDARDAAASSTARPNKRYTAPASRRR